MVAEAGREAGRRRSREEERRRAGRGWAGRRGSPRRARPSDAGGKWTAGARGSRGGDWNRGAVGCGKKKGSEPVTRRRHRRLQGRFQSRNGFWPARTLDAHDAADCRARSVFHMPFAKTVASRQEALRLASNWLVGVWLERICCTLRLKRVFSNFQSLSSSHFVCYSADSAPHPTPCGSERKQKNAAWLDHVEESIAYIVVSPDGQHEHYLQWCASPALPRPRWGDRQCRELP